MADRPDGTERNFFVHRACHWRRFAGSRSTEWPAAGQHHEIRLGERGIAQNAIAIALDLQRKAVGSPACSDPGVETIWAPVICRDGIWPIPVPPEHASQVSPAQRPVLADI